MIPLITLHQYKNSEGLTSPKEDVRTESLIGSVSQLVKTYCATDFLDHFTTPKEEFHSLNWDTDAVQLRECPAVNITSLHERIRGAEYILVDPSNYYLDTTTDTIYRTKQGYKHYFPKGNGSVKVSYTSGYSECPLDLQLAVSDLVTYYLKDEHKERRTLQGASVQNAGSSVVQNSSFPDHIRRVLDLYKIY